MFFKAYGFIIFALLPFLSLSISINKSRERYADIFFFDKQYLNNQNLKPKWMKTIDDKVPLDLLIIPGTHDSATYCINEFKSYAVTQSLTISQQLEAGIRYLDIRLCYSSEDPTAGVICHGILSCKLTFEEVMQSIIKFLTDNPSEGIILKVKNERKLYKDQIANLVGSIVLRYTSYFLQTSTIPLLGQLRGKFLLMPNDITLPQLVYIPWLQTKLFAAQTDFVYKSKEEKKKQILAMDALIAQNTFKGANPKSFYVNEFSASGIAAGNLFATVKSVAKDMNSVVTELRGRVGIIIFDYPSQDLISYLLNKYFNYVNQYLENIIKKPT